MFNLKDLSLEKIRAFFKETFQAVVLGIEIVPIFREAAEGEGDEGGGWHGWAPIGIPGAKFHAMTGQMEKSHDVRRARSEGRSYRNQSMGRPDYYGAFEKTNSLKM